MVLGSKQNAALLDKLPLTEFSLWEELECMPANSVKSGGKDVLLAIPVTLSISRKSCWLSLTLHYWSIPADDKRKLGSWYSAYHINLLRLIYRVFCQASSVC